MSLDTAEQKLKVGRREGRGRYALHPHPAVSFEFRVSSFELLVDSDCARTRNSKPETRNLPRISLDFSQTGLLNWRCLSHGRLVIWIAHGFLRRIVPPTRLRFQSLAALNS